MTERIRVLCVDDHPDILEALCAALSAEPDLDCVGGLSTADDLVQTALALEPHVILLDLTMPGRDPLEALHELSRQRPEIRGIVLSGHDDQPTIDRALDYGAFGYLSKDSATADLMQAIRRVFAGDLVLPSHHRLA